VNQHSQQGREFYGRVRGNIGPMPVAVGHGADTQGFGQRGRAVQNPEGSRPWQETFRLSAQGASVAQARALVRDRLSRWDLGEGVRDDAVLVISELFTNAIVHTGSVEVTCHLRITGESVYLAVGDQGLDLVGPHVRAPDAEGGRGLLLVGALAEEWGVDDEQDGGRIVWALLRPSTDVG
jgi:serine/threonine-protein kinase RsbW